MIQDLTPIQTEVLSRLDAVADKLGVASEHLWEIFAQQAVISGMTSIITCGLLWLISLTAVLLVIKKDWVDDKADHMTVAGVPGFFGSILLAITTGAFLFQLHKWIAYILNPEYFAWKEIQQILS